MTFRDGGAYDFQTKLEMIKETLSSALEEARESGRVTGRPVQSQNIDLSAVHLDQLPAYEEVGNIVLVPGHRPQQSVYNSPSSVQQPASHNNGTDSVTTGIPPPNEPPPGYEEAQRSGVASSLEASVRHSSQ